LIHEYFNVYLLCTLKGLWCSGNPGGTEEKLMHFRESPLKSTFLVMEMYENVLIIQWIHSKFRLLDLSNYYGVEI